MPATWEDLWRAAPTPTDKVTAHSYLPIYEQRFGARREEPLTIVEVGVLDGGSLELWHRLFPRAWIIGIDIAPRVRRVAGCTVVTGDSRDNAWARRMFGTPMIDVFIDDGDHAIASQIVTYAAFRHAMRPGGLYFVEDIYPFEGHVALETAAEPRSMQLHDLRKVKGRIDDVLLEIRF